MTLYLVTTCDLMTFFERPFFNLLQKLFDLVTLCNLVTVFADTKSVTKSRLPCIPKKKEVKARQLYINLQMIPNLSFYVSLHVGKNAELSKLHCY